MGLWLLGRWFVRWGGKESGKGGATLTTDVSSACHEEGVEEMFCGGTRNPGVVVFIFAGVEMFEYDRINVLQSSA